MEIRPECVPCLIKRCIYETRLVDSTKEYQVVKESLRILNDTYVEGAVSADIATKIHKKVYEIIGTDDPYREMKRRCNEVAKSLLPRAEEFIRGKGLREAALVSVVGNVMDFGFRDDYDSPDYLTRTFDEMLSQGFGHDDIDAIEKILYEAENVVFFTDNTGEIVLDTLLLKAIKEYDIHLTVIVKGEPILTDATMEDALEFGIDKIADCVETTGGFAIGVDPSLLPEGLEKDIREADLIIAKGMANWESLSETDYRPIAYLTRSKCRPVADSMGVPLDVNVAKLFD